jgi:hypothetical protein
MVALSLSFAEATQPAEASNPVGEFLRSRQQMNGGAKMLAPVRLARQRLQSAATFLEINTPESFAAALQAVRTSSLNCYVFNALSDDSLETRASLVTQQFKLSDPCTFRIVLKSATSYVAPVYKDLAYEMLGDLIVSYEQLDASLVKACAGDSTAAADAQAQLADTQRIAADIEQLLVEVLDV